MLQALQLLVKGSDLDVYWPWSAVEICEVCEVEILGQT